MDNNIDNEKNIVNEMESQTSVVSDKASEETTVDCKIKYNNEMHKIGRIFTWVSVLLMLLLPLVFGLSAKAVPSWKKFVESIPFMLGFAGIAVVEFISYAPLLGTGGHYLAFITGNIANLKLPCAINAQQLTKVEQGTEEHEVVTTISIAVSSIVTTLIILIGLIPLAIYQKEIVKVLSPISPYIMPAIFGGLMMALIALYWKNALAPFIICAAVASIFFAVGKGSTASPTTMVVVGMVVSLLTNAIMSKKGWI